MKKLMMLAAILALVLALAAPAIAQINQGEANRSTSGNFTGTFTANSTGNNGSQCVTPEQFGNTGPQQNTQGIIQYASFSGDLSETGPDGPTGGFNFAPVLTAPCDQKVEQSSAASQ